MHNSKAMAIIHIFILATTTSLGTLITEDYEKAGLKTIPDNLSPNTHVLLLKMNDIRRITNSSLINYPNLIELDLKYNGLRYINDGAFENNPMLKYLSVSYNGLRYIPADFGAAKYSLVTMVFYNAMAIELTNMNFSGFSMLYRLVLGRNPLSNFDASNLPRSLVQFNLGIAGCTIMPDFHLYSPNITTIKLSKNKLSIIPDETLVGLLQLKELAVQYNNLTTIPGVGVTKPIFSVPLFSQFFGMMKTMVT